MTPTTNWTGREANALRKALRMSMTDFAEHLGVARRTVAKWSSRGRSIQLRPQMQAMLDIVLARAPSETRDRFERILLVASGDALVSGLSSFLPPDGASAVDAGVSEFDGPPDEDGDMRRREILTSAAAGGVMAVPAIAGLLDALLPTGCPTASTGVPMSPHGLAARVAAVKSDYQACRYDEARDRLVPLLPAVVEARSCLGDRERARLDVLAADMYHVLASLLLKHGDHAMALVAAERSARCGSDSADPVAAGASARIMAHVLMANGHGARAAALVWRAAAELERATHLGSIDSVAVYGALLLRGSIAAAQIADRGAAGDMLEEAARAAGRLERDRNDRWTGFGPTNVQQHRVTVALLLGDAGTAVDLARRVRLDKINLVERKASLFVDVAQAYAQWGRHEKSLSALLAAFRVAPEEVRSRPAVRQMIRDLVTGTRGQSRRQVLDFAADAGIRW